MMVDGREMVEFYVASACTHTHAHTHPSLCTHSHPVRGSAVFVSFQGRKLRHSTTALAHAHTHTPRRCCVSSAAFRSVLY